MKVQEQQVRDLLIEMGAGTAAKAKVETLARKINNLHKWGGTETEFQLSPKMKALYKKLLRQCEDGEVIEVVALDGTETKPPKPKAKNPGVIDSLVEFLSKSNQEHPVHQDKLLALLVKRFPDRRPEGMKSTINQITSDFRRRGLIARRKDGHWWIEGPKKGGQVC